MQHYLVFMLLACIPVTDLQSVCEEVKVHSSVIWWLQSTIVGTPMSFLALLYFLRKEHSLKGNIHFHWLLIELQRSACIYIHCITIKVDTWKWTWGQVNTVPEATENAKLHMQYMKKNFKSYSFLVDDGFQTFAMADIHKNDEQDVWIPYFHQLRSNIPLILMLIWSP